jgi:hypothetical protein
VEAGEGGTVRWRCQSRDWLDLVSSAPRCETAHRMIRGVDHMRETPRDNGIHGQSFVEACGSMRLSVFALGHSIRLSVSFGFSSGVLSLLSAGYLSIATLFSSLSKFSFHQIVELSFCLSLHLSVPSDFQSDFVYDPSSAYPSFNALYPLEL